LEKTFVGGLVWEIKPGGRGNALPLVFHLSSPKLKAIMDAI
jgi:hypothetical protein